jgi:hypothetical protein
MCACMKKMGVAHDLVLANPRRWYEEKLRQLFDQDLVENILKINLSQDSLEDTI